MNKICKNLGILWGRLTEQGLRVTAVWAADHLVRVVTGAPIRSVSQITPQLHVGGQYRQRGWGCLRRRGITAVINVRAEFDDKAGGLAPRRYLHLSTPDDHPPSLDDLCRGVDFIRQEIRRGGAVYIHCGAGVGRAPTLSAAYLVSTGMSAEEAWKTIREVRPFVRPKPAQAAQIKRFEEHNRLKG